MLVKKKNHVKNAKQITTELICKFNNGTYV